MSDTTERYGNRTLWVIEARTGENWWWVANRVFNDAEEAEQEAQIWREKKGRKITYTVIRFTEN